MGKRVESSLFKDNYRDWCKAIDAWEKYGHRFGERGTPCISYWYVGEKEGWRKRAIGEVWSATITDGDMEIRPAGLRIPINISLVLQRTTEHCVAMLAYPS